MEMPRSATARARKIYLKAAGGGSEGKEDGRGKQTELERRFAQEMPKRESIRPDVFKSRVSIELIPYTYRNCILDSCQSNMGEGCGKKVIYAHSRPKSPIRSEETLKIQT